MAQRMAVIGAGWAGLTAAVRAVQAGWQVTVFEMASRPGGRARTIDAAGPEGAPADNGQHILIGAYVRVLALMRELGVDPESALARLPLTLRYPDGSGLVLPPGPPWASLLRGVAGCEGWGWTDRLALVAQAARWGLAGFTCDPALTVDTLCRRLPPAVRRMLIDPLCVAAMNTPAAQASASVFLRVLRDGLFGGRGSADLLLPRRPLDELLPLPATAWLGGRGAELRLATRVQRLATSGRQWTVDDEAFDSVLVCTSAVEGARLLAEIAPDWARQARALRFEPIVSVVLRSTGTRLPAPMMALADGPQAPAQFIFDQGRLGLHDGQFACVVSGARHWVDAGLDVTADAVVRQLQAAFPAGTWARQPDIVRVIAEKRATFRCTPQLARPATRVAPGLAAAGDFIDGPYPATLEGAVRSAEHAVAALKADLGR